MPTNCQTEIKQTVDQGSFRVAQPGFEPETQGSQLPSMLLLTPHSGFRIKFQIKPMMTTESTVGMKIDGAKEIAYRAASRLQSAPPAITNWVLHQHVDGKEDKVIRKRSRRRRSKVGIGE